MKIRSMENAVTVASKQIIDWNKEHIIGLYLGSNRDLLSDQLISMGILTMSISHPRELFKPALIINAAQIVLLHNHPSGNVYPSDEDKKNTGKLHKAAQIMCIPILDHIIFNKDLDYYSFKNRKKYTNVQTYKRTNVQIDKQVK